MTRTEPSDCATAAVDTLDATESQPLLLRAEQAAALCCVSVRTWRTWHTSGRIPRAIYIGRVPLWRRKN